MKVIADFLGAKSTWDVTNGKLDGAAASKDYLFVVTDEENHQILARAGHPCMILKEVRRRHQVKLILCMFRNHKEVVADHLRQIFPGSEVRVCNPYEIPNRASFQEHILDVARMLLDGVPVEELEPPF
jgi:hypothetical protein